jgi:hypothetical protein
MDLKFYAKHKQGKLLWFKTVALFICSGLLCFGNASAQTPGTALDFESVYSNKVVIPSGPALNIANAITIEAWIYVKSTGGQSVQDVISKSSSDVNNSYIFPRTSDRWQTMQFLLKLNGHADWSVLSIPFKSGASISTNAWHHVAGTYDGGTMRIYVDGVLKGSLADQGTITVNSNPLVFGGQTGYEGEYGEYFQGKLDEVRIWNRALSLCELVNNRNCELTGSEFGLNAYYKFNNGFAGITNLLNLFGTVTDATSNHNDGSLVNFLLTGLTSNWTTNPNVNGNCTAFTPINATAGSGASTIAVGQTLQLTASGGASYSWTGPNGFTSTQQNPTIANAQLVNSGTYTVVVTQGGCSATAATTVTVALRGKALLFDGNNDMIRVPDNASLNNTTFTLEAWVKPQSSTPAVQNVISKTHLVRLSPDKGYIFPRTDDGWLNFSIWLSVNGQGITISAPFSGGLNNWAHVAATYDGFNVKLYLNGNLVQTQLLQGFTPAAADITMGVQDGGYIEYYKGGLDEVRIWRRALSQCEIQNNLTCELNGANNGLANVTGLGAYFRFNQGLINVNNAAVTTLADSSGNGNNGTLTNFDLSGTASNWAGGGNVNNATCAAFQEQLVNVTSNGPVVEVGKTVQLFASGGTNWSWTGPNNFTSNVQNPTIPNGVVANTGLYTVTVQGNGGCSIVASTKVSVAYKAYSLNLDGDNDEIKVPASASLNNISKGLTIEAWIYPTSSAKPIQDVICKSTSDVNNGYIFPRTDNGWNSYVFYLNINNAWQILSAPYPGLNQWHHVAATYDGYYMRIYLDGVLSASREVYGTITQNTNDLIIGQQPGFEEHFAGSVDDARIWNRALNQCEIMNNLYCELHPLQRNGLIAYYKFNQGFDNVDNTNITTLVDSSNNGNDGTLKNFSLQNATSNWVVSYSPNRTNSICVYNQLPNVTAFANGTLFSPGSTIKFFANGGFTYFWDGPNAYHVTEGSPTIVNAQPAMTGTYTVTAPFVNCVVTASTRVVINQNGAISVSGPLTFCPSGSVTLRSNFTGSNYQWYRNDIAIAGGNANSYVATQTGTYTLSVTIGTDVLVSEAVNVTVEDNLAPVPVMATLPTITLPTPATIVTIPTAVDNCAGIITATTQDPLNYLYEGNYTITWKYDDRNGHVVTQTQQVVVTLGIDYKPPVLTVPANINLSSDVNICGAVANFAATATDNSTDPVTITYSQNPGTVFPVGTTTVLVTATDATGNAMTGTFNVSVSPTVVAPITGNTTICAGTNTTLATTSTGGAWSSSDNAIATVDAAGVVTGRTAGSVTITYTNACGAKATKSVTVNAAPATPIVNVSNNCGNSVLTVSNPAGNQSWSTGETTASITVLEAGAYTVTQTLNGCTSTAGSGFAAPVAVPATPVITVRNDCGSSILSTDAGGTLSWSNGGTGSSITVNSNNNYTVTSTVGACSATSAVVTVTINTNPVVAAIAGASTVVTGGTAQFTDATNGGVWSSADNNIASINDNGLVTGVAVGSTTIYYTVTSNAGCSTRVTAPITVNASCTAPVVTASNITANTLATATACSSPVTYSVSAGINPVTFSYTLTGATTGSGSGTGSGAVFNVGVTTVKVTATNACGSSSTSFTVTLKDGTAPVPVVSSLPTITGQCSVNLGATTSNNTNVCQDDCTCCRYSCHCRTSTCTCRNYDYRNIVSYILSYLYNYYYGDDNHGCDHDDDDNSTATNSNAPKATDNCKGTIVGTTTDPLSYSSQGTYTIHWKYDDGNGNVTVQEQTVIVKDDTKPTITIPANVTLNCGASTTPSSCGGSATGTDNCSSASISYTDAPNAAGTQILRTWKATDAAGNFSTGVQTITITDNTKPVISDVADITVSCNGSTDPSATGRPTAIDCSAVTITSTDIVSGNKITRTWKATDVFGNYSTSTQVITLGVPFSIDVVSVPTNSTYTGGIVTNLYLGYGAQSTKLQTPALPSSGAPYTYSWDGNGVSRLSSTTSASPVFSPNTYGSYTFTVTATNKFGCTSTDYITICVTDIRVPGSNGKKVYVCHQTNSKSNPTQTIEVSINAVPAHLGDGSGNGCGNKSSIDRLGSCDQSPCGYTTSNSVVSSGAQAQGAVAAESGSLVNNQKSAATTETINVIVLPNPSTTYFTLKFESKNNAPMNLRVLDGNGRVVDARSAIVPNTSLQIGHNYSSGTYYAEVIQGGQRKVVQLIKARG